MVIVLAVTACGAGSEHRSARGGPETAPTGPRQRVTTTVPEGPSVDHDAGDRASFYIRASDQPSDGHSVAVEEAVLGSEGGWIVVHSPELDVIGVSKLLPPGPSRDITVPLTSRLRTSDGLLVMLHREDNANTSFDYPTADKPVLDGPRVVAVSVHVNLRTGLTGQP